MLQLLNSLFESGVYDQLYKAGLISSKVSFYRDIYLYVDAQMRINGRRKTQAVIAASVKFDCTTVTVYSALKALQMPLIIPKAA